MRVSKLVEVKPRNIIELEVSIQERPYKLALPVGAPLGDAYNATIMMANSIVQMMQKDINKRSEQESAETEDESNGIS